MTANQRKVRATFEITCFSEDGIDGIKDTLLAAKKEIAGEGSEGLQISIRMVSSPLYEVSTQTTSKSTGVKVIKRALELIKSNIKVEGINF